MKTRIATLLAAFIGVTAFAVFTGDAATTFSFQAAFDSAAPGATIVVPDGSYPAVTLNGPAKSAPVTFQAQDAGQVQVASLSINVDKVHFVGIIASGTGEARGSLTVCGSQSSCPTKFTDVVIDGFHGKSAFIRASYVTLSNFEIGGANACQNLGTEDALRVWGGSGVNATPDHDTIVNGVVHDWSGGSNGTCDGTVTPTPHLDCMQNQGGTNLLVQNVVFYNCPSSDVQMEPFSGATIGSVAFDHDYFGRTACCNSIVLGQPTAGACPTLAVTNSVYFSTPNVDKCTGEVNTGNTLCKDVTQAGCAVPASVPPPVTAPPPVTTPPPTTPPPPVTPPAYTPACAPDCDAQLAAAQARAADLQKQLAAAQALAAAAQGRIDAYVKALAGLTG